MTAFDTRKAVLAGEYDGALGELYADLEPARRRFANALTQFAELFGDREVALFSAPGRTEIGGNHTDHQRGAVLAAAVNRDVIAIAAPNSDHIIRVQSKGYKMDVIDLNLLEPQESERESSPALVRGVAARFKELGLTIGGFDAYTTSDVIKGSGLSSSAAFEVLLGTILSHIYNGGTVNPVNIAQIGQYAENRFFGKPSGLMDQTASAVGGFVGIDFYDEAQPVIKKVDFDFSGAGITLCITDTVGDHADLTGEYAAITLEMREIAGYFGQTLLSRVDEDEFYSKIAELRQYGDRAVLRAAHFFADTRRAKQEKDALQAGDFARFLQLVGESGDSSAGLLQNIYAPGNPREQGLNLALCLSKRVLGGQGACRVHGGGFGGTIQAFVPTDMLPRYKAELEAVFGEGRCHALSVRRAGGIKLRAGRH